MRGLDARCSRRRRAGVALVLVLWIVVILGTVGATVVATSRQSVSVAANLRASVIARAAAESGIEATVAAFEDTLASMDDSTARGAFLNAAAARTAFDSVTLGDGRFAVVASDPGARVDVNLASEERLARFFTQFTDPMHAEATARAIRAWIARPERAGGDASPLRTPGASPLTRPLRSLEELNEVPGIDARLLQASAPYLTVDGDGSINRALASDTVLVAATGDVRDTPSRIVLVSRGWMSGHPLTREIQAVYAVADRRLVLVHWRERTR